MTLMSTKYQPDVVEMKHIQLNASRLHWQAHLHIKGSNNLKAFSIKIVSIAKVVRSEANKMRIWIWWIIMSKSRIDDFCAGS